MRNTGWSRKDGRVDAKTAGLKHKRATPIFKIFIPLELINPDATLVQVIKVATTCSPRGQLLVYEISLDV